LLEAISKIPVGTLSKLIDLEALEQCARKQPTGKATRVDGTPRELR
jgi:hypothetical protein